MKQIIVHSIPGSPYGRAVLATLEEKETPYRLSSVAPGTAKSQPHLSRHPFGRVPALEHGGYTIYETQAILRYLDRVLPRPSLTPPNPRDAGLMDQLMNICDWYYLGSSGRARKCILTMRRAQRSGGLQMEYALRRCSST